MSAGSDDGSDRPAADADDTTEQPSPERDTESGESGSVAGTLARAQPLEPQKIDPENAAFVLFGAVLVAGFVLVALLGL